MSKVLAAISSHAIISPESIALEGEKQSLSYARLEHEIYMLAAWLREHRVRVLGLMMDNTPGWVVNDLAALSAGIPVVPMPLFFSPRQIRHLLDDAGVNAIVTDQPDSLQAILNNFNVNVAGIERLVVAGSDISLICLENTVSSSIPAGVAKVTYTSGTTGEPKGACLCQDSIEAVATSLLTASQAEVSDRHLCLLPLATLLENIGGVYVPLLAGAVCILPGLANVGMLGAAGLDVQRFVDAQNSYKVSTCIMIPQMLHALITALKAGAPNPENLRYVAVGGAVVSVSLLEQAANLGLIIYEGYGLSEAASVVAVNSPLAHRVGSVGKILPHVSLRFAGNGEILVSGSLFSGYLGQIEADLTDGYWPSGDIGYMDNDGYLHITGRKKHIFITAFGRNVSPEWVEGELTAEAGIAQACVFGESKPFNVAVITSCAGCDGAVIDQSMQIANSRLPDYARVRKWIVANEPFSVSNNMWTGTSRPRREHIWNVYSERLESLYSEE